MHPLVPSAASSRSALAVLTLAAALGLAGCTPSQPSPPPASNAADPAPEESAAEDQPAGDADRATAVIAGQNYAFELTVCLVEPDAVLASGGGQDSSGGPVYLDLDLVIDGDSEFGGARIELGTDQPFDSREKFLAASVGSGDAHTLRVDGPRFSLEGTFRDASGDVVGGGTITADCG